MSAIASVDGAAAELEDFEQLYRSLANRLERLVRLGVRAPDPVIEDACQFAWTRLIHRYGHVRREAALGWLVKTAVHEAFKVMRRDRRELSLEAALESGLGPRAQQALLARSSGPAELLEQKERLGELRRLPERQQRLLWLHAVGLSYAEMARHEGYTPRTVERQLMRAKQAVRDGPSL